MSTFYISFGFNNLILYLINRFPTLSSYTTSIKKYVDFNFYFSSQLLNKVGYFTYLGILDEERFQ